jgi:3-oxoacyl-[acyl-carrier-protein] synthase-1
MNPVYIIADAMISALGNTSDENFNNVIQEKSGISKQDGLCVSRTGDTFENLCRRVLDDLESKVAIDRRRTLLILSTTKGQWQVALHVTASKLGFKHYQVVSNACSSGVAALLVARRLMQAGQFDTAVVIGADVLSDFITSGFQSLLALSDEPCRPFDAARKGINLGEAVGAVLLSTRKNDSSVTIAGGGMTNDANHISSPSRTGAELAFAIRKSFKEASIDSSEIDFVSAHGTATLYNDEMEAKAFHLARVDSKPVHSLKGFFGHTLGAAGVIETIMCVHSLRRQETIPSLGFSNHGVSLPLNVCTAHTRMPLRNILKTASGFGGTNAAIIFSID